MVESIVFKCLANAVFIPGEKGDLIAQTVTDVPASIPTGDYGVVFAKMFLSFIALILLLVGTYWVLRRLIQQRLQKGNSDSSIQILEKRMISPKTMLYLIEVENKKVLIAESHLEVKKIETLSQT